MNTPLDQINRRLSDEVAASQTPPLVVPLFVPAPIHEPQRVPGVNEPIKLADGIRKLVNDGR